VLDPVFSPDGSQIAFSWKPPRSDRFQLAVIAPGSAPRVIATGGVATVGPVWSPDGKQICFLRQGLGESALYLKTLRDGAERRVMTLTNSSLGDRVAWIANSRTVVVADTNHGVPLTLVDLETGARRYLPADPTSSDTSPKSSPDGKWIAFCRCFTQTTADLFVVAAGGGVARRLTFDGALKREHRWTPDGLGILFKARLEKHSGLWHVPAAGGTVHEVRLPQVATGAFDVRAGRDVGLVVASAEDIQIISIFRIEIPAEGRGPSRPVRLISAGDRGETFETNPAISPDGLQVAFVSFRSGVPEIWISDNAGESARQLTSLGGPQVTQPAWSPDGRYLLSASETGGKRNLFRVEVASGAIRRLPTGGLEETEPQWSRDGRWITFASRRSGTLELWRMPAAGGVPWPLTHSGAAVHRESPDGRWLYFVDHYRPGLWRIPRNGGKAELVLDRVYPELYRAWAVGRRGVYYTYKDPAAEKWTVALYDPESRSERALAVFNYPLPRWSGALTVSPDERWMLLPMIEAKGSRLVLFSGVKV
jgi:Tol biopolymer transport system component